MDGIRPAIAADADALARIYRPYVQDTAISFEAEAPTAQQMAGRMQADPQLPWLVAEADDAVLGYAYASVHRARAAYRWSVDVSVYLDQARRRRGTGRALYEVLLPALQDRGHVSAFAGIALPNEASVGLHEALGFTHIGTFRDVGFKLGAWHDVGWWQCRLQEPTTPPPSLLT